MRLFKHITVVAGMAMMSLSTTAETVEQARQMMLDGDYATALPIFEKALAAKPKDGSLNQWVGVCLLRTGKSQKAERYLKAADERKVAEAPRYLAEAAIMQYKFSEASDLLDRYEQAMRKAKKTVSTESNDLRRRAALGQSMLDRVEKITIIDSLAVDREEFFKAYHLSPESGTINSTDVMPDDYEVANPSAVYMTQSGDLRIWAAPDKDENYILMGATRLTNGSWDTPYQLGSALNNDGDCNYPFMMPDGVTLYYANNGAESLGGYDIFISRKDDNGFLKPQNVGMPYNSADDDYLLAIDEVNGIGWWATDRNHLGDKITIYRFIPSELRVNYSADEPKLVAYARISSYRDTWADGADYSELLSRVDSAEYASGAQTNDFYFAMPGNKIITSWDDLSTAAARTAMEEYLEAKASLEGNIATLDELRLKYANGDHSTSAQIISLEKEVENGYTVLHNLSNKVVRANGEAR